MVLDSREIQLQDLKTFPGLTFIEESFDADTTRRNVRVLFKEFDTGRLYAEHAHKTLELLLRTTVSPYEYANVAPSGPGSVQDAVDLVNSYFPRIAYASKLIAPRTTVYDLGCGVGHVINTLAILHPESRCIGIERVKERVANAEEQATRLQLGNTTFLHASADSVDFEQGAFFYLYHPFNGGTLRNVFRDIREAKGTVCFVTPTAWTYRTPRGIYDGFRRKEGLRMPARKRGEDQVYLLEAK